MKEEFYFQNPDNSHTLLLYETKFNCFVIVLYSTLYALYVCMIILLISASVQYS